MDAQGTPSTTLAGEIAFVDRSIGQMIHALDSRNLRRSTLIVVTAKHGQSPIDPQRWVAQSKATNGSSPASLLGAEGSGDGITAGSGCLPASEDTVGSGIGPTEDDISLIWLNTAKTGCDVASAVAKLQTAQAAGTSDMAIGEIFYGNSLTTMFNKPGVPAVLGGSGGDSRTPDIVVQPNIGHTYTGSSKKQAEHGGFEFDDTNVMLLVSNPAIAPKKETTFVETAQVAPTVLHALGLAPTLLDAVRAEGTTVLPGLPF